MCVFVHEAVCVHICMCRCVDVLACMKLCVGMCACAYMCMCMCACACVYTCAHVHGHVCHLGFSVVLAKQAENAPVGSRRDNKPHDSCGAQPALSLQ